VYLLCCSFFGNIALFLFAAAAWPQVSHDDVRADYVLLLLLQVE
jgi:hypothetical protein